MLAYIKANYQAGDTIEVTSSQGVFAGAIEYVTDQYIVLRQPNGQICGIAASDISTFRANCPVPLVSQQVPATQAPAESKEAETDEPVANETTADEQTEQTVASTTVVGPKVIGHIDLETLKEIDPKSTQRRYFKTSNDNNEHSQEEGSDNNNRNTYGQRQPFVSARGRITYYNNDKRYGFIHDFNSDNDLYFNLTQVADYDLYNHLHKGTKVVYTMDRNAQGFTARCVHLANTASNLIDMANDLYDARRYAHAQGLVEHVLEVDENNKEAKDLLDEIRSAAPTTRFAQHGSAPFSATQYNPCAIYSQAKKAYLAKDYAQAEELYKKAIEAGEKPESCVKDLVTLYVSRYKQAGDEEERETARNKAIDFLESHRDMLPDNLTTKQFLALNYYLPILDYSHFIATVDEILADPQVSGVISRRVFYIWQKGIALNKMGRTDEALKLTEEGLELAPRSRQLLSLRNIILHPEYQGYGNGEAEAEDSQNNTPATDNNEAESQENGTGDSEQPEADNAKSNTEEAQSGDETGTPQPDSWWDSLRGRN